MTIYKNNIILNFNDIETINIEDVKYCWKCKIYKDKEDFKSLYEEKHYNKTCRNCLDKMNKYFHKCISKK